MENLRGAPNCSGLMKPAAAGPGLGVRRLCEFKFALCRGNCCIFSGKAFILFPIFSIDFAVWIFFDKSCPNKNSSVFCLSKIFLWNAYTPGFMKGRRDSVALKTRWLMSLAASSSISMKLYKSIPSSPA